MTVKDALPHKSEKETKHQCSNINPRFSTCYFDDNEKELQTLCHINVLL